MALERHDERAVLERVRQLEPALVPRVAIEVHDHLVHPAELGVHHVLDLLVAEPRQNSLRPRRELRFHFEGHAVAGVAVGVPQARVRFVERVPGRPQAVEVERRRADLAVREPPERLAPARERTQVAVAVLVLDLLQLAHEVVGSGLEARVASGREHETHGREVMARDVAGEIAAPAVPAVVRFRFARESRAFAIVGEHPVGIESQEVGRHQLLRVLQWPAREPYRRQGERPSADRAPPRVARRARGSRCRFGERRHWEKRRRPGAETELQSVTARQRHGVPPDGLS